MVLLCFRLILIVGHCPIFGYLMFSYCFSLILQYFWLILIVALARSSVILCFPMVFHWFSFVFDMFPVDFNRRPLPDLRLSYDFLPFSYGFPMLCYVSNWFESSALARSSVILWFPMVSHWFSYVFVMFLVDFNRRLSPGLQLSYGFLWFCMVFQWFCYVSGWF